uniref:hypothetical protein n=3 Tax=Segatella hominis TaxID=2518605 RepID=UPI003AB44AF9
HEKVCSGKYLRKLLIMRSIYFRRESDDVVEECIYSICDVVEIGQLMIKKTIFANELFVLGQ